MKVKFVINKLKEKKYWLVGMFKELEWVLYGFFLDRILLRNYLSYNIVGEIMFYVLNVCYCELFVNGEY